MSAFWKRFSRNIGAVVGVAIMAVVLALAVFGPWIAPGNPWDMAGAPVTPPLEEGHVLGTDMLGRDVWATIVHGARVSLIIGAVSTAAALLIGVTLGAIAGYAGGFVDDLIMRFTEFFQAIPSFVLALLIVAIFQPSVASIVLAVAIVSWPPVARVVRGEFLSLRSREFVQAAVVLGQGTGTIVFRQILPNALSPIVVLASFMVATAILLEAALSFLGLGDPNVMSWGFMIGAGRSTIQLAWWTSVFPGIALFLTVLALNLIGEGLSDALNPRLHDRGGE
ncbi:ABC transporter permease [Phreatobacter sp. AB_2022a]|uniref:ABC transporter permease n=1 Tax=Phreatobacter sp. AB_2022a TaxID=3003134 RepID=UPI00228725D5|nr:ABC transporter permease [Phreatobacter sp. AB_2022a]MCZ0736729.1 ABC transporter permease [Phreatobacter sp. AB_2022a]